MTFNNGLPYPGEDVEVKTIWNSNWHLVKFKGVVSSIHPEKGHYGWFGIYAKPNEETGSKPIVTEWRYPVRGGTE